MRSTINKYLFFTSLSICFFLLCTNIVFSQYQGPIPAITTGYGAKGTHTFAKQQIVNDYFYRKKISVFYPKGVQKPVPTIFVLHGFAGTEAAYYEEMLKHIASWGYAAVFVPYKSFRLSHDERYVTLYEGFLKAAKRFPNIIDTSRIGFYGHSYGGGAIPAISDDLFKKHGWGANGKFIYSDAPWYAFQMPQERLDNYPTDCNMLTVVHDEDTNNDHRIAMDIFRNSPIDKANKDFIISYSNVVEGYEYVADHVLPIQNTENGEFDALDYYVTFRLLNALAAYTFTGDAVAKKIALGNGRPAQTNITPLKKLYATDNPTPIYPESRYLGACSVDINERKAECNPEGNSLEIGPSRISRLKEKLKRRNKK